MRYKALFGELYNKPHLIHPAKLEEIAHFLRSREAGVTIEREFPPAPMAYLATERGARAPIDAIGSSSGGDKKFVAVMPLFGTLWQHGGMEMEFSGGTSTDQFGAEFSRLASISSIASIILEIHSPGGQVWGTAELADLIFYWRMRGKRIVSVVNSMAASAALWIATAAPEVVVTLGGEMGSIGVVMLHEDVSGAEEKAGVRTSLVAHPPKKVAGHPYAPLPDEVRSEWLTEIKQTYQRFVSAVARNRNVSSSTVENKFGGGGMLRADAAVAAGLADRVETKAQTISREVRLLAAGDGRKSVRNRTKLMGLD
jgi:capsid assembly protease